jgi:hypothetical protein
MCGTRDIAIAIARVSMGHAVLAQAVEDLLDCANRVHAIRESLAFICGLRKMQCNCQVIIVKFIFQFGFFEWNKQANLTLTANDAYSILTRFFSFPIRVADFARVLGIYREDYYSFWDVALLVALFFHRYNLRKLGLWRDANVQSTFSRTAVQVEQLFQLREYRESCL